MLTFKVALRNVFRQKRRTLLTVLTMLGGFCLASISLGMSDGTYNRIIDMFTRNQLGHIQIHGQGYLDRPSLYNTVTDFEVVGESLDSIPQVIAWAPRVFAAGLGSVGEKTTAVRLIGVDPERETATTRLDKKLVEGRLLDSRQPYTTVLGKGLAEVLKAGLGDTLVVVSQGADGSIANDAYEIIGLLETGDAINDQSAVYLSLEDAHDLLVLYGRVHEIAVVIEDIDEVVELSGQMNSTLAARDLDVAPWQEFAATFYTAMQADRKGNWIMLGIIVTIVSVGVLNTVLMTVLERTREYGVLRAIGVRPFQVMRLVVYEVGVMATMAMIIGGLLGSGINYWLSFYGIPFPEPMTYGGIEFTHYHAELTPGSIFIPAITVFLSAMLVSLFPAAKAAKISPAKAMRSN